MDQHSRLNTIERISNSNMNKSTLAKYIKAILLVSLLIALPLMVSAMDRTTEATLDTTLTEEATLEVVGTIEVEFKDEKIYLAESPESQSSTVDVSLGAEDVSDKFTESSDESSEVITEEETKESVGESIGQTSSIDYSGDAIEEPTEPDLSEVPLSESTKQAIVESCNKYGVPIPVALAVINTESNFIDGLWSEANCYGLMGLHAWYFTDIYTPEDNVRTGIEYLGSLIDEYGNIYVALNVYANGHYTGNLDHQYYVMSYAEDWSIKTGIPI